MFLVRDSQSLQHVLCSKMNIFPQKGIPSFGVFHVVGSQYRFSTGQLVFRVGCLVKCRTLCTIISTRKCLWRYEKCDLIQRLQPLEKNCGISVLGGCSFFTNEKQHSSSMRFQLLCIAVNRSALQDSFSISAINFHSDQVRSS